MPQPKDHAADRGFLETVLRYIPGFQGYLEREYRREADELQRNWLAVRLQRSKQAIDDLARKLANAAKLSSLPEIDRLRARLDRLIGRIRGAMQGYSGFFDLVQIDVPVLERIYEHDSALNEQVDAFAQTAEQLSGKSEQSETAIADLIAKIDAIERQWDAREDILKGVK